MRTGGSARCECGANLVGVNAAPSSRLPLDGHTLAADLAARVPGWQVTVLPAVASTNTRLAADARAGAPEGTVLVTEHQTAGRGRLDRAWVAPPGAALTFSVLLRPDAPEPRWTWLPLVAGLAVLDGVASAGGPRCALKWPNDVLYAERKLAGLLAERVETPGGSAAVLGVGLNVSTRPEELPVESATSLALTGNPVTDRAALLIEVLAALAERSIQWSRGGREARGSLARAYTSACTTLGRRVRAHLPSGEVLEGLASDVDCDGALVVEVEGAPLVVAAGDVVHLRTLS